MWFMVDAPMNYHLNVNVLPVLCYIFIACVILDLFPPPSVEPLLGMTLRLHTMSAFAAWDYCK